MNRDTAILYTIMLGAGETMKTSLFRPRYIVENTTQSFFPYKY